MVCESSFIFYYYLQDDSFSSNHLSDLWKVQDDLPDIPSNGTESQVIYIYMFSVLSLCVLIGITHMFPKPFKTRQKLMMCKGMQPILSNQKCTCKTK